MFNEDYCFAVRSTSPNAKGQTWVVVRARDGEDAVAKATALNLAPYKVFPVPVDRAKRFLQHINCNGFGWICGLAIACSLLAVGFYRDSEGNIKMSWTSALGVGVLTTAVGVVGLLSVLLLLDAISRRILDRAPNDQDIGETVMNMQNAIWNLGFATAALLVGSVVAWFLVAALL